MTTSERQEAVRKNKLCNNCLRPGHFQKYCRTAACKICGAKHHTLLHVQRDEKISEEKEKLNETLQTVTNHITSENGRRQGILLATARILVRDKNGIPIVCRALLDGGWTKLIIFHNNILLVL